MSRPRHPKTRFDLVGGYQLQLDCRHYLGDRPCAQGCEIGCQHHEPMGKRILIIKLGALGDVIRTEALLPGLKDQYPQSHVTWISRPNGCAMLANNPLIDRLLPFDAETMCHVEFERFDLVINLDKEPGPCALAMRVEAADKRGMGLSPHGTTYPLNKEAHHYFALGLSDQMKFHDNPYTYQKLVYDALGLDYSGQRYQLFPSQRNKGYAQSTLEACGRDIRLPLIGLNTGAGHVFANKTWPAKRFVELGRQLLDQQDCQVALLGGPEETERNEWIAAQLDGHALHTGCHHAELDFAAIVEQCSALLTGDTTAMHIGVALRVPTVVLFGPTCSQEIDLYGRGTKLISKIECSPCYKRSCDIEPNCMDLLSVKEVHAALMRHLDVTALDVLPTDQAADGGAQCLQ